jgi:hypothetical protein
VIDSYETSFVHVKTVPKAYKTARALN